MAPVALALAVLQTPGTVYDPYIPLLDPRFEKTSPDSQIDTEYPSTPSEGNEYDWQIGVPGSKKDDMGEEARRRQKEYIRAALVEGQPGKVMAIFLDPANNDYIMRQLPATTFIEALRLLSPSYFVEPWRKIQRSFHSSAALYAKVEPLEMIFTKFAKNLTTIVEARRQAGHTLGLAEYTHLLDCARSMGNESMANTLWESMIADGVTPDVLCYNHYMEAKVWNMAFIPKENHSLRSTPWIYRKRRQGTSNPNYRGYKTGTNGVRDEVHDLFKDMVVHGLDANESTFIQLMIASGREWDIASVKDTLKTVWNIDTSLLQSGEENLPPVTPYPTSSPLHPTDELLLAVAHIFCTNNDISTALQLVDFISVSYNVPIPRRTWMELFVWSYILSTNRYGPNPEDNMLGHIPKDSVIGIFKTMTSEPYNIEPTLQMYDVLTKLNWGRQAVDPTEKFMRDGRELFNTTLKKRRALSRNLIQAWKDMEAEQNNHEAGSHSTRATSRGLGRHVNPLTLTPPPTASKAYWNLYHRFEIVQMAACRELDYLQSWALFMLLRRRWTGTTYEWERRGLPDIVKEWKLFLPHVVRYHITGGMVEFDPSQFWGDDRPIRATLHH
ncbi:uncharacterized protein GIQ15_02764 [Arthroderma uncinatum]|uniref:uncharacterized protein n=1 Tax=Arthroderma uncinatum TaxID=74035 RepID=UPI00144A6996|nr:uncharacterized protein GIQ15_02764 [Arthroderma uncinatum]KAF3483440.1 hypothetical protein GIQ15_02764 [Arthroderma uncinatum]